MAVATRVVERRDVDREDVWMAALAHVQRGCFFYGRSPCLLHSEGVQAWKTRRDGCRHFVPFYFLHGTTAHSVGAQVVEHGRLCRAFSAATLCAWTALYLLFT